VSRSHSTVSSIGFALGLGACAVIPDIPSDFTLPVQEILAVTACDLQDAFYSLETSREYARFKPRQWLVTVVLLPKVDTDLNASGGLTRKDPFVGNPTRFVTWAFSSPGIQLDAKGERSSQVKFNFVSGQLMKDKTLLCPAPTPTIHLLSKHLGIGDWLRRVATALNVASSAKIDNPTYNTDITIKLMAGGSYTYTFPPGTDLASLSGNYSIDEQLNISMVPIADAPPPLRVVTLPVSKEFQGAAVTSVQMQAAQARQDLSQIEQAIRTLTKSQ
jgi:hypothetical protein